MPFDIDGARQAGYSDSDIAGFMAQQNPKFDYQGAKASGYSDSEIVSGLSTMQPSSSPISDSVNNAANAEGSTLGNWATQKISGPSMALQTMGNEAQPFYDAAGRLIPDSFKKDVGAAGNWVGDKLLSSGAAPAFDAVGNPIRQAESSFAQNHPELTDDAKAIAKLTPLSSVTNAIEDGVGAMSEGALSDYTNPPGGGGGSGLLPSTRGILTSRGISPEEISSMTPKQIADTKNQLFSQGIVQNIQDANSAKSGIYSMANEVGNDDSFNAASTKAQLDKLHDNFSNDPQYNGSPLVKKLNSWKAMFDNDGSITPTRLNALQDQIDDAYKENPKSPEGDIYKSIQAPVQSALAQAKEQFPHWGALLNTADDAHYNMMKNTQEDSTFTSKWSPDSQKDVQIVSRKTNNPADYSGDTQRQINSLTSIQDEPQLQKTMSFVPKELQGQFIQDVANNSSSSSNIKSLAKSIYYGAKGNYTQALANAIKSLPSKSEIMGWDPDAATHISDRIQQWKDAASNAYQSHVNNKLAQSGANASTQYSASTAQKMLPSPSITVNKAGTATTPSAFSNIQNPIKETGIPGAGNPSPASYNNGTNAEYDSTIKDQAMQSLQNIVNGRRRGGAVLTPKQIKEKNKKLGKTSAGRKAS